MDFQVVDGKAVFLCASNAEKVNYKDRFLAFRTRYPAEVSHETIDRIRVIGQKIADAFELKNSPMLVQLLTDDHKESVLEFSARTGGGAKYLLLKEASGFDPITGVLNLILGKHVDVKEGNQQGGHIINEFLYCKPGILDHPEGFEELKKEGLIFEYWQFKGKGTEIKNALTSSERVMSVTIKADSYKELLKKQRIVSERIRIIDEQGNDIMRHDMLTDMEPLWIK